MHKDCVMLQYAVGLAFDYSRTPILTMYSIHLKLCRVFSQELRISKKMRLNYSNHISGKDKS